MLWVVRTGTFTLYVNSDDGFRLRRNGTVIGEFVGPTGLSDTTISNVTLNDGDVLRLTYFERGGGAYVRLRINSDSGTFVGETASGRISMPERSRHQRAAIVVDAQREHNRHRPESRSGATHPRR